MRRLIDGLEVPRVDIYGSHTGDRIASEFATAFPDRVRRVVLDGIVAREPLTGAVLQAEEMYPREHFPMRFAVLSYSASPNVFPGAQV